jgi:IS1 family transposase
MWLWVTMEAATKVIPVFKLGPRSLDMAMGVIHELFQRMQADCWPIFSWVLPDGARKPL